MEFILVLINNNSVVVWSIAIYLWKEHRWYMIIGVMFLFYDGHWYISVIITFITYPELISITTHWT